MPQKGVVTISIALALATPGPELFCFNNDIRSSRVIYSSIICTDESFDSSSIHISFQSGEDWHNRESIACLRYASEL